MAVKKKKKASEAPDTIDSIKEDDTTTQKGLERGRALLARGKGSRTNLEPRGTMSSVLQKMDPKYVVRPDDFEYFSKPKIFMGIIDIELFLVPVLGGRTCYLGAESSGKTVLSKITTGALQRTCRQCYYPIIPWIDEKTGEEKISCKCGANESLVGVFIDIEDSFDPLWARRWGVNIGDGLKEEKGYKVRGGKDSGLWVVIPTSGDYALDFTIAAVEGGAADFVVLDSIAFVLRSQDKAKLVGDAHQPMQRAAFIASWLYKLLAAQIQSKMDYGAPATLIWTNQFYMGMPKTPKSDPRQESGGTRIKQFSSTRMKINSALPERPEPSAGPNFKSRYLDVKFSVIKAKTRTPQSRGEYRLYLDNFKGRHGVRPAGTSDDPDRLATYLGMLGLFEKRKKSYWCLGREFKKVADIYAFLSRPDIAYISRYFIMRTFLSEVAQEYLLEADYAWGPFGPDPAFELLKDFNPEIKHEKIREGADDGEASGEGEGSEHEKDPEPEALSDEDLFG